MKTTLSFDSNNPDDEGKMLRAVHADDLAGALWDIAVNLKKTMIWELEQDPKNEDVNSIDHIFEAISDIISDHGIDIEKLY